MSLQINLFIQNNIIFIKLTSYPNRLLINLKKPKQMQQQKIKREKNFLQTQNISIYEDKYLKITPLYILIDRYYFPLATSKTIFYPQIKLIQLKSSHDIHTIWGISRSELNHWFHFDRQRKNKKLYLSIQLKNKNTRIGLTPEKPLEAFNKLRELFIKNKSISGDIQMDSNISQLVEKQSILITQTDQINDLTGSEIVEIQSNFPKNNYSK